MSDRQFTETLLSDTLDPKEIAFYQQIVDTGGLITPAVDVRAAIGFSYPSVGEMLGYGPDHDLDYLRFRERQNLLAARFHDRVNLCPDCQHVTVNFREVCPQCNSSEIGFESVIHHFRCAFVGREEQFRQGVGLVCPKCQQTLRSLGKDYEKPTDLHHCMRCESLFSEPEVHGLCLRCRKRFPQQERVIYDVVEFRVTAAVVPALRGQKWVMGYPPSVADELPNVVSEEFLLVMLELEIRRAVRHSRPLSAVCISSPLLHALSKGRRSFVDTTRLYEFAEKLDQVRRNTDIVGRLSNGDLLFVLTETNLDAALREAESLSPGMLVVDSIQTVYTEEAAQAPGSIVQLRQCTMQLMRWAKGTGVPTFIVGHVTKDGDIAGPRLLEHIVDVVLYLEGERFSSYRLLRSVKNRFGSIDEVGVFEMTGEGMAGVDNPSEAFIAERARDAAGSVIVPTLEGSRPLLVEVQALTSPTAMPTPRRTANGLDFNRLLLVSAVLTRRLGLSLAGQDVIASVVGGLRVREPAMDLGLALAIVSSYRDKGVPADLVALGEVGLSGELRSVSQLERRLAEAERMGFRRCLLPEAALARARPASNLELLPAASLREAVRLGLG